MLSWGGRDMIEEELFPFVSPGGPSNWPRFPRSFRLSVEQMIHSVNLDQPITAFQPGGHGRNSGPHLSEHVLPVH